MMNSTEGASRTSERSAALPVLPATGRNRLVSSTHQNGSPFWSRPAASSPLFATQFLLMQKWGAFLPEGQKMRGKKGRLFPEEKVGGVSLSWQ